MPPAALLIGISGPSSSGKTTLSRLLRDIIPSTFILHLDDFYYTDVDIPVHNGLQDWDCLESINLKSLQSTLQHVKAHGTLPPSHISIEDQNAVGESGVHNSNIVELRERINKLLSDEGQLPGPIVIVDGFLLFSEGMREIRNLFDVKLFLRTSYETAKKRREARAGYVTIEGFWEDPPGYVDKIVWPNYVADHSFLFEGGDVAADLNIQVCEELGIIGMPRDAEGDMNVCLEWAVHALEKELHDVIQRGKEA